jgi:hypothetical protein
MTAARVVPTAVATLAVAAALAGCGGGSTQPSAGTVIKDAYQFQADGQYGRAYALLHPSHQALITRGRYEDCERQALIPQITRVETVKTYTDPLDVLGIPQHTSEAVTVRLTTAAGPVTQTNHAVKVAGQWRWIFSSAAVRAIKRGGCPN